MLIESNTVALSARSENGNAAANLAKSGLLAVEGNASMVDTTVADNAVVVNASNQSGAADATMENGLIDVSSDRVSPRSHYAIDVDLSEVDIVRNTIDVSATSPGDAGADIEETGVLNVHVRLLADTVNISNNAVGVVANSANGSATTHINSGLLDTEYDSGQSVSYEILFDVMEEVIEVFQPRIMHIGHDELYHIGVCPRCRKRTGHELLARDLLRIHEFLSTRGVRPFLWGDKLMHFIDANGRKEGGVAKSEVEPCSGKTFRMRPTWKAAAKVPKDLLICDWYWSLDPESERHAA